MKRRYKQKKGFSLVEMVVVLGIMVMMLSIMIANFPAFRSQISLSIALHEMQLSLRQAQSYAIAVREFNSSFVAPICQALVSPPARFPPYGVSITKNTSNYVLFADIACSVKVSGPHKIYNSGSPYGFPEAIATTAMQGGVKVTRIDGFNGGSGVALNTAEIVYQRPSPSIIMFGEAGGTWNSYQVIDITLSSNGGAITKVIRVRTSGQISIQ
ncbi:MAG: prepilin-type N-terminal cleavage/methylation domain-containing protein [bacterium]|nr:prepilin-type N-terminal cleavage/methylation domain-containing protein [bacterium]